MRFIKELILILFAFGVVFLILRILSGNHVAYIIQKQSLFEPSRWDNVIDVYGFSDDYSVAQDIANFLKEDGGKYRVVSK